MMENIKKRKPQPPSRIITLAFALVILIGSILLILPISAEKGVKVSFLDALYTSTSAVCVTGLVVIDVADNFSLFGEIVVALLMQIGGLGVTCIGVGIIMAARKKVNFRERNVIREALNFDSGKGVLGFVKNVFKTTLIIEGIGAVLSFIVFSQDYPFWQALEISIFHSIASFNNSGFDILGGFQSLTAYEDNILLNLTTAFLIIAGGIGFLVIREMFAKRFRWKKFSMHAKVVLTMTLILIVAGTVLLKITSGMSWLGAFFHSVSTRTAGFATYDLSTFASPPLIIMIVLMFIGASPGSTGGGIKTSTCFVLFQGVRSAATNKSCKAFHYSLPKDAFRKASVILLLGLTVVLTGTIFMCMFEPTLELTDVLFEVVSAYGTVGLSTGITQGLSSASKILSIMIMFFGRLGPFTIVSMWYFSPGDTIRYPEGNIAIG